MYAGRAEEILETGRAYPHDYFPGPVKMQAAPAASRNPDRNPPPTLTEVFGADADSPNLIL